MERFPLHRLVFNGDAAVLQHQLDSQQFELDEQDHHGNTPLQLALQLGHSECAAILLRCGADPLLQDRDGWAPLHHATCLKDAELMSTIISSRAVLLRAEMEDKVPQMLSLLDASDDFYVEMTWEFSTWIPLMSRLCPSDTYRIWKKGHCVRVDTTLIGYQNMRWQRGNRSFIFRAVAPEGGGGGGPGFEMTQLDHDRQVAVTEAVGVETEDLGPASPDEIEERLHSPVKTTVMDPDKIEFARVRSGFWGWQSDRTEDVGGYEAKVFNASGIEVVTKTRFDHLPAGHPARKKATSQFGQLMSGLGGSADAGDALASSSGGDGHELLEEEEEELLLGGATAGGEGHSPVGAAAYFGGDAGAVVGAPRDIRVQKQKFKARLWMSDTFPLSLQQQVLPIIDLLAPTSPHLAKLRDFISLQLPSGFPAKIEIPVYHVMSAKVTFAGFKAGCEDASVFDVPPSFRQIRSEGPGGDGHSDPEDAMLALALQQSMRGAGAGGDDYGGVVYDGDLQRALLASLDVDGGHAALGPGTPAPAPRGEWACVACTFVNKPVALFCEVCATRRPAPPPARQPAGGGVHGMAQPHQLSEEEQLRLVMERSLTEQ